MRHFDPAAADDAHPAVPTALDEAGPAVTAAHPRSDWRLWLALAASFLALGAAILDFALVVGAVPIPVPGLRPQGQTTVADTATYSFENGVNGWATRGAATREVLGGTYVLAGRHALGFQVANLSSTRKAFVYTARPAIAERQTQIVAHLYVPAGAPLLVATTYVLDRSWAWSNGPFPVLTPGQWTAVTYAIPTRAQLPIRELGLMILTAKGARHYSGPLYLDAVDVRHAGR